MKPCPFCGNKNLHKNDSDCFITETAKWGSVVCTACGARGPDVRTGYSQNFQDWQDAAIMEWNIRV